MAGWRIFYSVNISRLWPISCKALAGLFFLLTFCALGQDRQIRLRHGTIVTPTKTNAMAAAKSAVVSTGAAAKLYLIQLEGPASAAKLAQLRANGVEIIKYVPDDTFIGKLVSPDAVLALPAVRWVGPYQAEYKIHPRLSAAITAKTQMAPTVAVNILLSASASTAEIAQVQALLATMHHESRLRQGTLLSAEITPARLTALAQAEATLWIEPAPKRKLVDETASKIIGGDDGLVATPTLTEQLGFDGRGVTVCVADTGLDTGDTNTMHPDLSGRVIGLRYYGDLTDGSDGYGHGTHCAGIVAGNAATGETDPDSGAFYGLGIASGASLFIERIFDDAAGAANPFPSDETLTHDAVRSGAKIGSNSWGNDVQGEYDTDAAQFDELVRDADATTPGDQPYILEFSAGNAGPGTQTVGSPATAKNVLSTGASQNYPGTLALTYGLYADGPDTMADFSSRGPCADGRLKPDLVTPGTWIASAASANALDPAATSWSVIDDRYVYMGGTSMAGPYAAGAAAVFVQFYASTHAKATPSPALVKAALINSCSELDQASGGPGPIPNFDEGWGRLTLTNIINTNVNAAPRFYQYLDQSVLLEAGQVYSQHVFVQTSDQPLKITLAYTDVAGFPGANPALVNDLDLEVVGPDGTLYRGNQFAAGESVPNPPTPDSLNNVEAVHLARPTPGDYLVRVRARNVVQDARLDTAAIDQDFALVISGNLVRPGTGAILLDRAVYTAPDTLRLAVLDAARSAASSVNVTVKSTTEPLGETYVLHAAGNYGVFTGAVATAVGPASADGKLQLHDSDVIEADYLDIAGTNHLALATAHLAPPVLSGVATTSDLGIINIVWQSSTPANSVVYFSTNFTFNLAATNASPTTSHDVKLTRLVAGLTYHYFVVSTDAAGNTATNNNAGTYYSFIALAVPTVLLVDGYDTAAEEVSGSTVIPDSAYTNALAATGYRYSFWKVNQRGYPQLSDLQGFPVVLWRTTDDSVNYGVDADGLPDPAATNNTLNARQQFMIQSYLNSGGAFFMASMNILSQLGNVPFRKTALQVDGFIPNPDPPAPCSSCDEDFGVPALFGAPGNAIAGGMAMTLDYSAYPSFDLDGETVYGPDFSDTFTPTTSATPIFYEASSGKPCGMSFPQVGYDSPGRVVFLSFPLDALPAAGTAPNNRTEVLRRAIDFLAPGANGRGAIFLDHATYAIPDKVTVEIGDSDRIGAGPVPVVFSTSATNQVTINLNETTHPGLFRGSIVLVATNAATGQITVRNGNLLTAKYFDASNGSNVTATATIDATPPAITNVTSTARYGDAQVSWRTDKPADSLVQYGDSFALGQTAYASTLVTNHSLGISGLNANRTYYFQVVSRDAAGNTAVDDNHGSLYVLQTLPAIQPPWFDDLESGAPNWTVVTDPAYPGLSWQLGTPANGLQNSAHSGTEAWGSNLKGQAFDIAKSFLYSPEIDLSGMSQATLTFWDSFDFKSGLEFAEVGISTNSSTKPDDIPTLVSFTGQTSDGWQEETIDLSAFTGKTIQIVWYYSGIAVFDPLTGWLVDDISVTGTRGGGTIVLNKNLGQGTCALTGPVSRNATLTTTVITNAPLGEYRVGFSDVAFYITPPPLTNTLVNGGTITFTGTYDFIDANHNGISDAWEDYYFHAATTNRTPATDTDLDGMTDYAEFIAGTDPTNAASNFRFLPNVSRTNGVIRLQWSAVPGRLYLLETSTNLQSWLALTGWQQAAGSPMTFSVTNASQPARLYRVQVRP